MNSDSMKEIYALIRYIIKKKELNKDYGLDLKPDTVWNSYRNDTAYLRTLWMQPKPASSISKSGSGVPGARGVPDKNRFTAEEIWYMLETKTRFSGLRWNNNELDFNTQNHCFYYSFSVPYFNPAHDKAIVMYTYHCCTGRCGSEDILLLAKIKDEWTDTELEGWKH